MHKCLYLISQDKNDDWDTYDSAVVVAKSNKEARGMHPHPEIPSAHTWCKPEYVKAKYLGIARPGLEGVICASFNAGRDHQLNPDYIRRTMKHLQFTKMTPTVYDVMTALRGPDCQVLARALKWVITGRIRFYVMRECFEYAVIRRDTRADSSWAKAHRDWDKAVEAGVSRFSLDHWTEHAELALRTIHELCLTDTCDVAHQDEIHIMLDLLNAARTALSIYSNPDEIIEAQQFVHTQLTRLQAITDDLAQSQEVTNE